MRKLMQSTKRVIYIFPLILLTLSCREKDNSREVQPLNDKESQLVGTWSGNGYYVGYEDNTPPYEIGFLPDRTVLASGDTGEWSIDSDKLYIEFNDKDEYDILEFKPPLYVRLISNQPRGKYVIELTNKR